MAFGDSFIDASADAGLRSGKWLQRFLGIGGGDDLVDRGDGQADTMPMHPGDRGDIELLSDHPERRLPSGDIELPHADHGQPLASTDMFGGGELPGDRSSGTFDHKTRVISSPRGPGRDTIVEDIHGGEKRYLLGRNGRQTGEVSGLPEDYTPPSPMEAIRMLTGGNRISPEAATMGRAMSDRDYANDPANVNPNNPTAVKNFATRQGMRASAAGAVKSEQDSDPNFILDMLRRKGEVGNDLADEKEGINNRHLIDPSRQESLDLDSARKINELDAKGTKLTAAMTQERERVIQGSKLAGDVMDLLEKTHPGIGQDPKKFGSVLDALGAGVSKTMYRGGLMGQEDKVKQLVAFVTAMGKNAVQTGRMNPQQYEELKDHLPQYGLSDGANMERLQGLMDPTTGIFPTTIDSEGAAMMPFDPRNPRANTPFDLSAQHAPDGGGTVQMIAPDGRPLSVPANKVAELTALGARRAK